MLQIKIPTIFLLIKKFPKKLESIVWIIPASIISNTLSLIIPVFFMQVYDRIIPNKSTNTLIITTVFAVLLILVDLIITISRGILLNWYSSKFSYIEGYQLMKNLFSFTNKEYFSNKISQYNESFKSIERLKRIYSSLLFQTLMDIPFIFVFLYAIYYISGKLVVFHISVILIYTIFNMIYHFINTKYNKLCLDSNNRRYDYLSKILKNIHPLKAQGFEEMLLRKLEIVQSEYSSSFFKMKSKSHIPTAFGELISQIMIYGTIVIGGILVFHGELSIGIISATTMLARRTVGPLLSISKLSVSLSEAKIDFERLKIFNSKRDYGSENLDLPERIDGYLEIRNLSLKKSNSNFGNLENINLTAEQGEITGIICQDTSAASILVDVILGIENPDSGDVMLDSLIISDYKKIMNIQEVVVIPRKAELFMGTILENITLFNKKYTIQALDAAAFLGLNELVSKLPKGYDTEITAQSEKTLTSSLIHRISIVRALINRPRVIISNQADTAMNDETKEMYFDILKKISTNTAIIMITDNLDILNDVDHLYLLQDSKLIKLQDDIYGS